MAFEFLADFGFAFVDLLRMALIVAVPAFFLVVAGQWVHSFVREEYKLSWIVSAFIACFVVLLPVVFLLYLIPYYSGYLSSSLSTQVAPDFMQLTLVDYAMAVVATIFKNLLSVLFFSILLMPFVFLGAFFEEKIKDYVRVHRLAITFASVFLVSVVAWIIVLFLFPWVVSAVLWKLYWGPI